MKRMNIKKTMWFSASVFYQQSLKYSAFLRNSEQIGIAQFKSF